MSVSSFANTAAKDDGHSGPFFLLASHAPVKLAKLQPCLSDSIVERRQDTGETPQRVLRIACGR
jgi:hypothetical protein